MLNVSKFKIKLAWHHNMIVILLSFAFNTTVIAQISSKFSDTSTNNDHNTLKFVVNMNTTDAQLIDITNKLAEKGATIKIKNLKRNNKQHITSIKIKMDYRSTSLSHSQKISEPITPIKIIFNSCDGSIYVKAQKLGLNRSYSLFEKIDTSNENNDRDFTALTLHRKQPLYILNDTEVSKDDMKAVEPSNIRSISVLKDKKATEAYGAKGKDGVIIITLKKL